MMPGAVKRLEANLEYHAKLAKFYGDQVEEFQQKEQAASQPAPEGAPATPDASGSGESGGEGTPVSESVQAAFEAAGDPLPPTATMQPPPPPSPPLESQSRQSKLAQKKHEQDKALAELHGEVVKQLQALLDDQVPMPAIVMAQAQRQVYRRVGGDLFRPRAGRFH